MKPRVIKVIEDYGIDIVLALLRITLLRKVKSLEDCYHALLLRQLARRDHIAWNVQCARDKGVAVGANCRLYGNIYFSSEPYLVEIGDNTIISGHVEFIPHDGAVYNFNDGQGNIYGNFGRIKIGRNCFIGYRSMFLPDVQIGDNCLVVAGSVVLSSFPDNSVIMGNPAKWVSDIEFYRGSRMSSRNTIRSNEYPFPREAEMPADYKRQMLLKHLEDVPMRRPRPKRGEQSMF
jgi:acetyltransferase-like isoleucine patch superfamily enzyme